MAFGFFKVIKGLVAKRENTLTADSLTIQPNGTASTDTTLQSSQTANRTITLPDATTTLLGTNNTATVSNKSIDADANTITNIENADIKAGAAIDATKIATGSVDNTEFGYLDGVTSSIQTQLNGKEPTITTLPISKGGTNSGTALNDNRVMRSSGGAIVEAAAITASRALESDANGIPVASAVTSTELGYVSGVTSAIQTQLNGKQASGNYITDLTGDATASGPGSAALTLATVNANVGSFGSATDVGSFTVNAKGLVTAASSTSIQIAESQVTNLTTSLSGKLSTTLTSANLFVGNGSNVATGVAASGDLTLANTGAFTIANLAVTNAKIANSTIDLTTKVTGVLPSANVGLGRTINAQTGTTYTFVLADGSSAGGNPLVTASNASAQTYTVPPNSSVAFPVGTQIDVMQQGAGKVTLAQGAGVTINSKAGNKAISAQYVAVSLVKTATDTWTLIGDLIA